MAADGRVVDVVVLPAVVGGAVTTDTESSVGIAAFPDGDVIDIHVVTTTKTASAMPTVRFLCVAPKVTL